MSAAAAEPLTLDTPRALARAITRVERGGPEAADVMRRLGPRPLRAWTIGVTGPPGAGKSTLVDRLIAAARAVGLTVGVIAVDPSSPFSGGAILGDRVRMMSHHADPGVFIRSMAARDNLGGLADATRDAARLLDAYGFDLVLLETVGVGQSELDVVKIADSVLVIAVPGLGDTVQTLKAGVLEIADLFVVNMADRPGADRTVAELLSMLQLGGRRPHGWSPPVLETVASEGRGVDALWAALQRHRGHLEASGELAERRASRTETEVVELAERALRRQLRRMLHENAAVRDLLDAARAGTLDSHTAAARLLTAAGYHTTEGAG
ncbi:MAG: methylmalonyl Co-A mutase-associated GTPase MeaB [Chloroflexi bacterium]|nr:methylmalonyl Co-A mutase-associated GTPase MeaB [Chloroflexota bacterium]